MNGTNVTNEFTPFGRSRYMPNYLEQFGKNMHNANINQQIAFKEKIKKQHNRKEIQMLVGRIEDMLDNKKSLNHLTTAFFAIITLAFTGLMNYGVNSLKEIDERAPYLLVLITVTSIIWFWGKIFLDERKELNELSRCKRLLQECLEELPEKKSKRRFLKLTNKYRTS
ncbi:hypothetical protein [Bacillus safensis]|uniref:hypothetical protein n=1 Tax=Bacillus safensis TaxID=561879 RepID=UPI0039836254